MNKNNNDFDVVSIDQKNTKSLVVFEINQVTKFVQKTSVGQFIKSQPFELNFPSSIGQSKWILMLFLNGQYEHGGKANENIFVYLKMVQCDPRQQSTVFKFDVTFQLGSEHGLVSKKNESLCYDNVRTRWIGTKLLNISEMISNGSRYIQNDTLMLSVFLNENLPKHVAAETWPSFNKTFMEKESYAKAVPETKTVSMPVNSSPPGHNRYSNSNQYNTGAAYDLYQNNNLPRNVRVEIALFCVVCFFQLFIHFNISVLCCQ